MASYLNDHLVPLLIGRDARKIEDIWQYLYKGAYWRRGPVTMTAIAAVDTALWDIKGKACNQPVYQLLGGASRDGVMVYGHANGEDIEQTVEWVGKYHAMGYKAIRAQSRRARAGQHLRRRPRIDVLRAGGAGRRAGRERVEHRGLHRVRAEAVRTACARSSDRKCTCCTMCITA